MHMKTYLIYTNKYIWCCWNWLFYGNISGFVAWKLQL